MSVPQPLRRVKLAITQKCQLHCRHCYLGDRAEEVLDTQRILALMADARCLGATEIDFTGAEPTTHPSIAALLLEARHMGYVKINLSTNGMKLRQPVITAALVASGAWCHISIDGGTQAVVDAVRGRNSYRQIVRTLDHLAVHGVDHSLRFSANSLNHGDIDAVMEMALERRIGLDVDFTQPIGNGGGGVVLTAEEVGQLRERISSFRTRYPGLRIEETVTTAGSCDATFPDLVTINTAGRLITCLMVDDGETRDATGRSLRSQWEGIQANKARYREFKPAAGSDCDACDLRHICAAGCLATAIGRGCLPA